MPTYQLILSDQAVLQTANYTTLETQIIQFDFDVTL